LKKPVAEEEEPEPEPPKTGKKGKKGKRGKNKTENHSEADIASIGSPHHTSREEVEASDSQWTNLNRKKALSKYSLASKRSRKGVSRRRKKEVPKTPQQILWENFSLWLKTYRVKHPWIISNLHREMALLAHALAFSWSKWNFEAGENRLIVRAAETALGHEVPEECWENFLVTGKRVMPLKLTDSDENFSDELKDGGLVMSNFYHMAKHIGSESLQSRLRSVDCSFVETVRELLDATQLLVYA